MKTEYFFLKAGGLIQYCRYNHEKIHGTEGLISLCSSITSFHAFAVYHEWFFIFFGHESLCFESSYLLS